MSNEFQTTIAVRVSIGLQVTIRVPEHDDDDMRIDGAEIVAIGNAFNLPSPREAQEELIAQDQDQFEAEVRRFLAETKT